MFLRRLGKTFTFCKRTIISSPYADITFRKETIAEAYFESCKKFSNRIALIDYSRNISYTYSDLERSIKGIASALTKKGLQQGSVVGIIATNCPEFLMLQTALSSMGCTVKIFNPASMTKELGEWITISKSTILFTSEDIIDKVTQAVSQTSFLKDIYLIGNRKPGYHLVEDLINDSGNMNPIGHLKLDVDNHVAIVMNSSGTTGSPKGIMLTHTNLVSNFHQMSYGHNFIDNMILLLALPMSHIYGDIIVPSMSIYSGSTTVILPKFEPIQFFKAIEKYEVNLLHLQPPHINCILNHPEVSKFNLSSIKKCISASSPLDALNQKRFLDKFRIHNPDFDVYQMYGSTESLIMTHMLSNCKKVSGKEGSIGLLIPNVQCKTVNISTREEVFVNSPGELMIKSPSNMKGYLDNSAETKDIFENGWIKTGDFGYYDADNYLYITDRIKDLIKVNGLQVLPSELERVLLSIPGIVDCVVIGTQHETSGEVPKAFIVRNKDISEKEINDYMANNLSSSKQLKGGICFINEIPRSPGGKILRTYFKAY